jgi:hypothetical protein
MKTIIAGSRGIEDTALLQRAIDEADWEITEVISGDAQGVDQMGEAWARRNNIPVKLFPAPWKTHKQFAGRMRNQQMAEYADALIVIWDGYSKGTADMLERASKQGLKICIRFADE